VSRKDGSRRTPGGRGESRDGGWIDIGTKRQGPRRYSVVCRGRRLAVEGKFSADRGARLEPTIHLALGGGRDRLDHRRSESKIHIQQGLPEESSKNRCFGATTSLAMLPAEILPFPRCDDRNRCDVIASGSRQLQFLDRCRDSRSQHRHCTSRKQLHLLAEEDVRQPLDPCGSKSVSGTSSSLHAVW